MTDEDSQLTGRLDHVESRDGLVVVVDFKSLGATGEPVSESVRTQLLFYAGLVHAAWGVWPGLAVSRPGRDEEAVDYEPAEALTVRADAAEFRRAWNEAEEIVGLAASTQRCRWCEYQAICPVFRDTFPAEMNADPRRTRAHSLAIGTVIASQLMGGKDLRVTVAQDHDLTCPAGEVTIARLPAQLEVHHGDHLSVARLDRGGGGSTLRAVWNSLINVTPVG